VSAVLDQLRMHPDGAPVCLNVGTRSTLDTPNFAIRDISGDLEDEEKIVFAERLMQQGILVRKIRAPS
jgi:hypothetical protein